MTELSFQQLLSKVDMLSYAERIKLLDKLLQTLHTPAKTIRKESTDFNAAFGLWKDREISIEEIRTKAWGRT